MDKIIDILPDDEKRKERILHAVKKIAQARTALDRAIDEMLAEVVRED